MDDLDTLDLAALTRRAEALGYVRCVDIRGRASWAADAEANWSAAETLAGAWAVDSDEAPDGDEPAALRWLLRQPEAVARAAV